MAFCLEELEQQSERDIIGDVLRKGKPKPQPKRLLDEDHRPTPLKRGHSSLRRGFVEAENGWQSEDRETTDGLDRA